MKSIINPNLYHGKNKKNNFFEGWYFKIVSKDKKDTFAIIPGISMGNSQNNRHSFIQILDGTNKLFNYCKFPFTDFSYFNTPFSISISDNIFSLDHIVLNINIDNISLFGELKFSTPYTWKDSLINPGSMGFYNYLTFMECYSQVCVLDGDISGYLNFNNKKIDFNGGKIYIEKNWGKSFPIEWLWIQSNTFNDNKATITCSVGEIPFPISNFRGFLIAATVDKKFYKFTTINRSKLNLILNKDSVELTVTNKNLTLFLKTETKNSDFILCYGPRNGEMSPYVRETLIGKLYMKLYNNKTNELIYEGFGENTGIEYGGKLMNN
ncbi:tocopherol cyclase family protein [Clostridium sp. D53t1_180928_C8]|uniref:tocopherol cyclase family protein n=1 Tax=Clostridium sp. D53t1_180928_C8 TaxID=2787101 RepID=UPI0018ABC868|nr:tocopherol cyclase family protein [Clostridium sp. D53t1_180928_C8]